MVKQSAGSLVGEAAVVMINVDDVPGAGAQFGVRSIPQIVVLKDGEALGMIRPASVEQVVAEFREIY